MSILSVLAESDSTVAMMKDVSRPVMTLHGMPQLTIAAVNGPAAGAGWGLVLACDIRIAARSARFGATSPHGGARPGLRAIQKNLAGSCR